MKPKRRTYGVRRVSTFDEDAWREGANTGPNPGVEAGVGRVEAPAVGRGGVAPKAGYASILLRPPAGEEMALAAPPGVETGSDDFQGELPDGARCIA
jgi:hypothetical protein